MAYAISLLIGIVTWPVVEYLLHRYLGHDLKINTFFKKEHIRHHAETDYFAPLRYKLVAAIPVTAFFVSLTTFVTGSLPIGITFTGGFLLMFSFYEYTHWSFHAKPPTTKLGMKLRKHHLAHHFQSPKKNHGVTSTWMDKLFGTFMETPIVKVPRNVPLPWLYRPGETTIDPKFSQDFQLK